MEGKKLGRLFEITVEGGKKKLKLVVGLVSQKKARGWYY